MNIAIDLVKMLSKKMEDAGVDVDLVLNIIKSEITNDHPIVVSSLSMGMDDLNKDGTLQKAMPQVSDNNKHDQLPGIVNDDHLPCSKNVDELTLSINLGTEDDNLHTICHESRS